MVNETFLSRCFQLIPNVFHFRGMLFSLFGGVAAVDPQIAYCIYKDRKDFAAACGTIIKEYEAGTTTYTPTPKLVGDISGLTTTADQIIVFIEDNTITSVQLAAVTAATKIYLYLCQVECNVAKDAVMAVIRPGFKYTHGPISFSPVSPTTITSDEIKAITANGCNITLNADMNYEIHDSFDSMFPPTFTVTTGKTITYKPVFDSFTNTRLVFLKAGIQWGKTTFPGGTIDFGTSTKVIISRDADAVTPQSPSAITGTLYFDGSWTGITEVYVTATGSTVFVTDEAANKFQYVTVTSPAKIAAYCLSTDGTGTCPSLQSLKLPDSIVTKSNVAGASAATATSIVAFQGDLTVAAVPDTLLTALLLTDDAGTITITGEGAITTSLDLRNPIWALHITDATSAANLLTTTPAKITLGGNKYLNPKVVKAATTSNAATTFAQAEGIALTDSTPYDLTSTAVAFSSGPIISPLFDEAKVIFKAGSLNINGAEIKTPTNHQVSIHPLPHETMTLSQDHTNLQITLETSGTVKFDETWNSAPVGLITFPATEHPMIETKYPGGVPPWLGATVATQGTVVYVPDAPSPKGKGSGSSLSGGAIAGIVIACVVVVAVIVVVALNATGIIHLCGKKKVEV